ncbi:mitochondrial carrier protein RIM2 [Coprinopsis cinerea AmutBmut pab1-1]|nr:mitochondrial carrier protein RIM2 [Coprinopsis cinerea AmutBmut pab1-1]
MLTCDSLGWILDACNRIPNLKVILCVEIPTFSSISLYSPRTTFSITMSDSAIHAIAGAAGGIVAMTATYPLIFLSTRAAVETKNEPKSTYQAVIDIIKREGVLGLYSGLDSSLLGIAVTNGVYYYFYERSREAILRSKGAGAKALGTLESMLTGLIAGSATTIISNPIWVVQTSQAVRTMGADNQPAVVKKLGFFETAKNIIAKDGIAAFWRGIGPALILVINPIIQYTVFEQLKNFLIARRTTRLRAAGGAAAAVAALTDWDFFLLGALSKLGGCFQDPCESVLIMHA